MPLSLIEVKQSALMTRLTLNNLPTAQVLREAHIVLQEVFPQSSLRQLPFVVTNSLAWSFGLAGNVGKKIKVTKCVHVNVDYAHVNSQDFRLLYHCLKSVATGNFPNCD